MFFRQVVFVLCLASVGFSISLYLCRQAHMPQREYFCHSCKRSFSKPADPSAYQEADVICPHCGSDDVELRGEAFYPISRRESA
jgi:DNA-directed RNA polymerase subunit RPC12/RpoP